MKTNKISILFSILLLLTFKELLSQTGTLDNSFNIGSGPDFDVNTMAIQNDGKILIGGLFLNYNGVPTSRIARLNVDGNLDTSFNTGTGFSGSPYKIKVLENGKIFISGNFTSYNDDNNIDYIVKLNSDGTIDRSFKYETMGHHNINTFKVLPSGKILLPAIINNFNNTGNDRRILVRLNSDGSIDNTFSTGTGFEGNIDAVTASINNIDVQSDGKIILGGRFYKVNGTSAKFLVRLNEDGSLDLSFNSGETGAGSEVTALKVLKDDKILIGGGTGYNDTSHDGLIRLNSNGSLDLAFEKSIITPKQIETRSTDDKVVVVGRYSSINGGPSISLAVYDSDGRLDSDFMTGIGSGPNASLNTCAIQGDGKILIGGVYGYNRFDGIRTNRIARIHYEDETLNINNYLIEDELKIYPNPVSDNLYVSINQLSMREVKYKIITLEGKVIDEGLLNNAKILVRNLNKGLYFIKFYDKKRYKTISFIKK